MVIKFSWHGYPLVEFENDVCESMCAWFAVDISGDPLVGFGAFYSQGIPPLQMQCNSLDDWLSVMDDWYYESRNFIWRARKQTWI